MEKAEAPFRCLLVHDGELGFVRTLLEEFGADFEERCGTTTHEDRHTAWDLVVANPTRMREVPVNSSSHGVRIAILSEDSRTLRALLRRLGVDLMVRRPVHPAAFRLLLLHALYRGPERRRSSRASVGGSVRIRLGFRRLNCILLDLSRTGCRIMLEKEVTHGKQLKLQIPSELAGGKKLVIRGKAVRSEAFQTASGERHAVGVVFEPLKVVDRKRLHEIVAEHMSGPTVMKDVMSEEGSELPPELKVEPPAKTSSVAPPRPRKPRLSRKLVAEGVGSSEQLSPEAEALPDRPLPESNSKPPLPQRRDESTPPSPAGVAAQKDEDERRQDSRRDYERRVIVLSDQAARVLLGRDLAAGGMRVGADSNLTVGDKLRIALHVRSGEVPLVVNARVLRDDGERGLVLTFHGLTDADRSYLEKMVASLPVLSGGESGEDGVVVTEILDRR